MKATEAQHDALKQIAKDVRTIANLMRIYAVVAVIAALLMFLD